MVLREILKEKQMSQEKLAKKLGITQQQVSKWCSKKSVPKISMLKKLSIALEVSFDELVNAF